MDIISSFLLPIGIHDNNILMRLLQNFLEFFVSLDGLIWFSKFVL